MIRNYSCMQKTKHCITWPQNPKCQFFSDLQLLPPILLQPLTLTRLSSFSNEPDSGETSEVPHQIPLLFPGESCQDSQNVWISSLKPFLWTHKISIWKCFVNFWEISHWSNLVSLDFVKKWPILNFKLHQQYAPQNNALFI